MGTWWFPRKDKMEIIKELFRMAFFCCHPSKKSDFKSKWAIFKINNFLIIRSNINGPKREVNWFYDATDLRERLKMFFISNKWYYTTSSRHPNGLNQFSTVTRIKKYHYSWFMNMLVWPKDMYIRNGLLKLFRVDVKSTRTESVRTESKWYRYFGRNN